MSTKKCFFSVIIIFIVSVFMPGPYEKMIQAYQTSLWTYDYYKTPSNSKPWHYPRYFKFQMKDHGFIGIEPWHRFRFGFPFRATTIDSNTERFIIQGKIQVDYILLNTIFNSLIFLLGYFIFTTYKKIRGKTNASS